MSTQLNLGCTHFSYAFSVKEAFSFHYRQPLSLVHSPDKLFLALMSCTPYKSRVVAPGTARSSRRPAMSWANLGNLPRQEICEAADWELLTFQNIDFVYQNPLPQPCCPHLNKFCSIVNREISRRVAQGIFSTHRSCFVYDVGIMTGFGLGFGDVAGVAVRLHKRPRGEAGG